MQQFQCLAFLHDDLKSIQKESNVRLVVNCIKILNQELVDIDMLTKMVHLGFDDETFQLRGVVWRLLLGYLPPKQSMWQQIILKNKENYNELIDENIKPAMCAKNDHPLSRSTDSSWNNYFKDQQMMSQIQKDVSRTRNTDGRITKILFLWCKLNKTTYIQGMNEVAALITRFFAFNHDKSPFKEFAESDAFFCFSIIMTSMKANFNSLQESIIFKEKVRKFTDLLKKVDPKLHDHLISIQVNFSIFCWKWFIAWLAQDFAIQDTLRIWDALICHQDKDEFIHYLCVSILLYLREPLMDGQFGDAMTLLQQLKVDVEKVIQQAYLLLKDQKPYLLFKDQKRK
ncbi:hypothetical protein pb186bvf_013438 [Paramecium bursaria]